jgi:hypothetical protein
VYSWQEKKAKRTVSFEPRAGAVWKRPTGPFERRVKKR